MGTRHQDYAEPSIVRNPDGTVTMDWGHFTAFPALVQYEALKAIVDEHNAIAVELRTRRAAMKHADDLGIDVAAVMALICPPVCETCKGTGKVPSRRTVVEGRLEAVTLGRDDDWRPCPACHGRSQHTLHDRIDNVLRIVDDPDESYEDIGHALEAILADVAKVTP